MPQALLLLIAGAGVYAGARWVSRQIGQMAENAQRAAEEMQRRADAARSEAARDLGNLVIDPATGQYRPKG